MGAEAQRRQHRRLERLRCRRATSVVQDRVVAALQPRRAGASSVANAASRPVSPRSPSSRRQHQVEVGVVGVDRTQRVVRRLTGRVDRGVRGPVAAAVARRPSWPVPAESRRSSRSAAAQSAAAHPRLAGRLHLAQLDRVRRRCRPARSCLPTVTAAGRRAGAIGVGSRHRAELDPLAVAASSTRPGAGVQPRIVPVDGERRRVQSISASSTVSFGASETPSAGCGTRLELAVLDAVQRRHQQPGAVLGQPVEQGARGVVGADRLGVRGRTSGRRRAPPRAGTSSRRSPRRRPSATAAPARRHARPAAPRSAG